MEHDPSLGCLIMAAGSGRRFGGNKLAADLDGKTLIRRALEAVPAAQFTAVTVVSQYEDIEALAGQFGFAAIHNDRPDLGLSSGSALRRCALATASYIWWPTSRSSARRPLRASQRFSGSTRIRSSARGMMAAAATPISSRRDFSPS